MGEYIKQKKIIEKEYNEFLAEVKNIYIFYNGKDKDYAAILQNTSVKEICEINKRKAANSNITDRFLNDINLSSINTMMGFGASPLMVPNFKKDADVTERAKKCLDPPWICEAINYETRSRNPSSFS